MRPGGETIQSTRGKSIKITPLILAQVRTAARKAFVGEPCSKGVAKRNDVVDKNLQCTNPSLDSPDAKDNYIKGVKWGDLPASAKERFIRLMYKVSRGRRRRPKTVGNIFKGSFSQARFTADLDRARKLLRLSLPLASAPAPRKAPPPPARKTPDVNKTGRRKWGDVDKPRKAPATKPRPRPARDDDDDEDTDTDNTPSRPGKGSMGTPDKPYGFGARILGGVGQLSINPSPVASDYNKDFNKSLPFFLGGGVMFRWQFGTHWAYAPQVDVLWTMTDFREIAGSTDERSHYVLFKAFPLAFDYNIWAKGNGRIRAGIGAGAGFIWSSRYNASLAGIQESVFLPTINLTGWIRYHNVKNNLFVGLEVFGDVALPVVKHSVLSGTQGQVKTNGGGGGALISVGFMYDFLIGGDKGKK